MDVAGRMTDFEERERCRTAASLYYDGEFTQEAIAAYLRVSRPWVSKLLKRARELGVVTIAVERASERPAMLERRLASALRVARTRISLGASLADAAALGADYLLSVLRDDDVVGMAWGRTMAAVVAALDAPAVGRANVRCVPLIGGTCSERPEIDADRLVPALAAKIGATPLALNAPAFVESERVRAMLVRERGIRSTLELAERSTLTMMCIGAFGRSTIREAGMLRREDFAELDRRGAVGDVCQTFIDAAGEIVNAGPNRRTIAARLEKIRESARDRIAVAAGNARIDAIVAAAAGGWFTTLITDLPTARALLDRLGVPTAELGHDLALGA